MNTGLVIALSLAGILFILTGLVALAVPTIYEGAILWRLDGEHTLSLMDIIGLFTTAMGVILTWLGGVLWTRIVRD